MYHTAERNARQSKRHALVLAISLHLALVALFYFKLASDSTSHEGTRPVKVNAPKELPTARAKTVQLP